MKKRAASYSQGAYSVSQRRACRVLSVHRDLLKLVNEKIGS